MNAPENTPEKTLEEVILKIHNAPHRGVLAVSGAGTQALAWVLGVAGASRTVLEAVVPYGRLSMIGLVGFEPAQFVSEETALNMAKSSYRRALRLHEDDSPRWGLACTAAIATDRSRRGEHRAYVATWDDAGWTTYSLHLAKGRRDRAGEEEVVSKLLVGALAQACGVGAGVRPEEYMNLTGGESVQIRHGEHAGPLERLLSGEAGYVTVGLDGLMAADSPLDAAILPGSFNPLHQGHEGLASVAAGMLGTEVVYELSVTNVDKPTLDEGEINGRLAQFLGKNRVALTRAETYLLKARLFPGCTFVIGWDTAVRLVASRYYGGDKAAMLTALAEIRAAGCSFLVAGREEGGTFRTLDQVLVPAGFKALFRAIPEAAFRVDISSTSLRVSG